LLISAAGMALPCTWLGATLGSTPLPLLYWPMLAAMLLAGVVRPPLALLTSRCARGIAEAVAL
jgi:hypothetical protein